MEGPQLKAREVQRAAQARMAPRQASLSTSHVPVGRSGTGQAARALFLQGWGVHGEQGLFPDLSHRPGELAQEVRESERCHSSWKARGPSLFSCPSVASLSPTAAQPSGQPTSAIASDQDFPGSPSIFKKLESFEHRFS